MNLGIYFYGILGSLCFYPGMNTTSSSNQGLFNLSFIVLSSEEEGLKDVLLWEYSSDCDEYEEGGVGDGPSDTMLGCGLSCSWFVRFKGSKLFSNEPSW